MHIQLSLPLQFYFICFQIAAMEMTRHQRLTDLNQCLIDMWGSITQNVLSKAVGQWKSYVHA